MLKASMKDLKDRPNAAQDSEGGYRFGPFRLEVRRKRLWRDGQLVSLTPKATDTLVALVSQAGEVVEKDDLMRAVWPDTFVTEDTLTQNISTLRKALGDTAEVPDYIATVPRRGYRFIAPVTSAAAPEAPGRRDNELARATRRTRRWMAFAVVSAGVAAGLGAMLALRPDARSPERAIRFLVRPPRGTTLASAAVVSPDGTRLVFVARDGSGRALLSLRAIDELDPTFLPDTDGASMPFWSPDGRFVGFFADGRLKTIPVFGEVATTLAETGPNPQGGTWNREGVILYAPSRFSGLYRVPASGGSPIEVTHLLESALETGHWWPQFLPDGSHFLFTVGSADRDRAGLHVGTLEDGRSERLLDRSADGAVYDGFGSLLFVRDRVLVAQPFDAAALRTTGAAVNIAPDVPPADVVSGPSVTASASGLLAFENGRPNSRLTWYDRTGRPLGSTRALAELRSPAMSADGRFVAAQRLEAGRNQLWLLDVDLGVTSRITEGDATGQLAVWSPEGERLAYSSDRLGSLDLYLRSTATGREEPLLKDGSRRLRAFDWSGDGRFLVYGLQKGSSRTDLWLLPMRGDDRKPVPFLESSFDEIQARVSPDSRWLAYASNESGALEVYLQTFPQPGQKRRVSTNGGAQPAWRGDGRELYYLAPDGRLMAVPVELGDRPRIGVPQPLFQIELPAPLDAYRNYYVVSRDGQRFLIDSIQQSGGAIEVVEHWRSLPRWIERAGGGA
jgi:DNA-binding winged helix-turn-helix (wHTH) protein/Tol biopolymer transport system component